MKITFQHLPRGLPLSQINIVNRYDWSFRLLDVYQSVSKTPHANHKVFKSLILVDILRHSYEKFTFHHPYCLSDLTGAVGHLRHFMRTNDL